MSKQASSPDNRVKAIQGRMKILRLKNKRKIVETYHKIKRKTCCFRLAHNRRTPTVMKMQFVTRNMSKRFLELKTQMCKSKNINWTRRNSKIKSINLRNSKNISGPRWRKAKMKKVRGRRLHFVSVDQGLRKRRKSPCLRMLTSTMDLNQTRQVQPIWKNWISSIISSRWKMASISAMSRSNMWQDILMDLSMSRGCEMKNGFNRWPKASWTTSLRIKMLKDFNSKVKLRRTNSRSNTKSNQCQALALSRQKWNSIKELAERSNEKITKRW